MNLFSIINPSLSVGLVRKLIKKQLQKEVKAFDVSFLVDKNEIYFIIDSEPYLFPDDNIKKLVEKQAKNILKEGDKLKVVILHISEADEINAEIYFQNKYNEKKVIKHKLN